MPCETTAGGTVAPPGEGVELGALGGQLLTWTSSCLQKSHCTPLSRHEMRLPGMVHQLPG